MDYINDDEKNSSIKTCCIVGSMYEKVTQSWPYYNRELNNVRRYFDLEIRNLLLFGYKKFISIFNNFAQLEMGKIIQTYKKADPDITIEVVSPVESFNCHLGFDIGFERQVFIDNNKHVNISNDKTVFIVNRVIDYLCKNSSLIVIINGDNDSRLNLLIKKAKEYNIDYIIINPYSLEEDVYHWIADEFIKK